MIPQKAIKKIKNDVHREIVVGHLLAYGFFPQTSEGIDQAKRFVAGLDQWIAPSDLPNYYDDIESDLMTGRETAGIRNIKMILEDFYFGGGSSSEPEEIPIEVEVVEVEQQQPDEPIVVTIEAPFENPVRPGLPRRVRLPRLPNTIKVPRQKKKDTAERMADAFDARLDDLLDNIRNPDPGTTPPRRRKKKQVLASKFKKVSAKFDNVDPYKAKTFTGFLGLKVKKAFGRAAEARRIAKEQGAEEQGRGYFLKKALGFEFGGDKLSRLKGTFSKSPTAVNDPALSADQRFLAGINQDITPPPVKQGELFSTKSYETKTGLAGFFDDTVSKLENSFARVDKKFADLIQIKKSSPDDSKGLLGISKTIDNLRSILKKNNDVQSDINQTKTQQLELLYDISDSEQAAAAEAGLESGQDLSSTVKYQDPYAKIGAIAAGGGVGGGLLDGLFDFLDWKDVKRFGKGALNVGKNIVKGVKGFVGGGAATAASIVAGAGLAASAAGEGFFQVTKKGGFGEQVRDSLKQMGEKKSKTDPLGGMLLGGLGNLAGVSNEATKTTGVALDAIGAPFRYAIEAIRHPFLNQEDKEKQANNLAKFDARIREFSRGWMNRIDFLNVISDEKGGFGNIYGNAEAQTQMMEKMSEGGVIKFAEGGSVKAMIGEAGPEMLMRNGEGGGMNPYQSLAPMIIATREITKRAGNWADPIENYVKKITDPIAKEMKLSVVPLSTSIGKNEPPKIKDTDLSGDGEDGGGVFGFIKKLFRRKGKKQGTKSPGTTPPPPGGGTGQWGPLLNLIASKESGGNYEAMYPSTTLPGATAMTISEVARRATGAVGKYQQLPEYLVNRAKAAGLNPDTDLYSPANQDLIAGKVNIGINRGGDKWLKGQITDEQFMQNLSMEFAALPNAQGQFYYPGQRSAITPEQVKGALAQVRSTPATVAATPPPSPSPTATTPGSTGKDAPTVAPAGKPQQASAKSKPAAKPAASPSGLALQPLSPPAAPAQSPVILALTQAAAASSPPSPIFNYNNAQPTNTNSLEALRQLSLGRR